MGTAKTRRARRRELWAIDYLCVFRVFAVLFLVASFFGVISRSLVAQQPKDSVDKDYAAELPRIAAKEPAEAMATFHVAAGFKIEQVAAEPLVADPVAIAFDENLRLFVVEMRGYSENKDEKVSRIRLLEDVDGDGRFDKSTIYQDGLAWPTAIFCWMGGVIVVDAPDMFYLKDTNGDGKAEERRTLYTGLGVSNVQGL